MSFGRVCVGEGEHSQGPPSWGRGDCTYLLGGMTRREFTLKVRPLGRVGRTHLWGRDNLSGWVAKFVYTLPFQKVVHINIAINIV